MSIRKKRYQLLPCNSTAAHAIAIRNFLYINWTCRRQQHRSTPSYFDAGCLFTQQKATWEGVLSVLSETVWPYLEERCYQDKHSWCCGARTWDWGKKKNPKGKDDEPASSQPLVRGRWSRNSPQRHKNKTLIVPSHHAKIWKPRYCGGHSRKSSVRWRGGALVGLWVAAFVGKWVEGVREVGRMVQCLHRCPPSCSSSAITEAPVPLIKQRLAHYSHNHLENVFLRLVLCCIKASFLHLPPFVPPLPFLPLWSDQGWLAV